ncbi:MAG: metallophosphoesterase family protein [Candidatus Promineifilaceae bacterium]
MKVAIFSDVHGNLTAFEAVLADIKRNEPDMTFFAGDLCLLGARPKACLDLLRAENISAVHGNTDLTVIENPPLPEDITEEERQRVINIYHLIDWTAAELGEMDRAYLDEIPFHHRVSPTVNPLDDLYIVHANPRDVDQPIFPNEALQKKIYNEIKQPDNDPDLRHLLSDLDTGVMAYGHVHIPNIRHWGHIVLANISSVSLPLDGDSRAKYGLLTWEEGKGWTVTHQYIEYNIEQERQLLSQKQPPNWESLSKRLG